MAKRRSRRRRPRAAVVAEAARLPTGGSSAGDIAGLGLEDAPNAAAGDRIGEVIIGAARALGRAGNRSLRLSGDCGDAVCDKKGADRCGLVDAGDGVDSASPSISASPSLCFIALPSSLLCWRLSSSLLPLLRHASASGPLSNSALSLWNVRTSSSSSSLRQLTLRFIAARSGFLGMGQRGLMGSAANKWSTGS